MLGKKRYNCFRNALNNQKDLNAQQEQTVHKQRQGENIKEERKLSMLLHSNIIYLQTFNIRRRHF